MYIYTSENFTKKNGKICRKNYNLRRRRFLVNCSRVIWINISNVQQYCWQCTNPLRWRGEIKHWRLARQRPLLVVHNLVIASKHLHNSLSSSCCSLLVRNIVLKRLDVVSISPSPSVCFQTVMVRFLSIVMFFKGAVFPKLNRILECQLLTIELQQFEGTNYRAWLNILCLGTNDVSAERSGRDDIRRWMIVYSNGSFCIILGKIKISPNEW